MKNFLWIALSLLIAFVALANAGGDAFSRPSPSSSSREKREFCSDHLERDCPPGFEKSDIFEGSPDGDRWFTCCKEL